ncbi:hypothetical protein M0P65_05240 [Candidatus Gracilibacteria bacterium]|nr:hypothetical protein [Candidatus Gracilibacteria bacterium]
MIGYKATENGKCFDQLYVVGKTYSFKGKIKIHESGYHFCKNLIDVFNHYNLPSKKIKVFKVEILGKVISRKDSSVTNKLKVLEEVSLSRLVLEKNGIKYEFDSNCNLVEHEYSNGFCRSWEYNEKRDIISYNEKTSDGFCEGWGFDDRGNLITRDYYDGFREIYRYNENNNKIKTERTDGSWLKFEYDENQNMIKKEFSNGLCLKYEYDKSNNLIKRESNKQEEH